MASNKTDLSVGDIVRVRHAYALTLSDTRYEITEMDYERTGYRCMVREINEVNPAIKYKPHETDVSILVRA